AALEEAETTDTDGIRALPGAAELLASGRRLAIVTSCTLALATVRLRAAGLALPEILVTADGVENGKPDPEPFRPRPKGPGAAASGCCGASGQPQFGHEESRGDGAVAALVVWQWSQRT